MGARHKPTLKLYRRTKASDRARTCIDLFSGAGGLAVGFRASGWSILAANDIDPDAGATFRLNFPEASFFEGPISELTARRLLRECSLKVGQLDCLIGGPPCQSFSYNNHQRSAGDARAKLFRDYIRLVDGLKPKMLVMENVPGILTIGRNRVIREIERTLARLGYDCAVRTLAAEEFGTPQSRRRVFIVASRIGAASALIPCPTHRGPGAWRGADAARRPHKRAVTVGYAIGDLPPLRSGGGRHGGRRYAKSATTEFQRNARKGSGTLANHVCHDLTPAMLTRIKWVPEGGNWRDIPRRLLTAGMQRARLSDHTKRYGRLDRSGLASTILTKCDPHWGAYVHPTQNRTISVREAARLQGFPDIFCFAGESTSKQYAQVGNAVPVTVAQALGKAANRQLTSWRRALAITTMRTVRTVPRAR